MVLGQDLCSRGIINYYSPLLSEFCTAPKQLWQRLMVSADFANFFIGSTEGDCLKYSSMKY